MRGANNTYFGNIREAISTLLTGLKLSFRHLWHSRQRRSPVPVYHQDYFRQQSGLVTLQYPRESIPVPDNGRYRLHNEIDDCIVCDKCAKVCPVDCIDIEGIKATEEIGRTSDGTPKRIYAARFDIDMGKCCFCGLCTTVCPTECLTMTKAYDFTEYDVDDHIYSFAEMTPMEILEKKNALEAHNKAKEQAKAQKEENPQNKEKASGGGSKPSSENQGKQAGETKGQSGLSGEKENNPHQAAKDLMDRKKSNDRSRGKEDNEDKDEN